MATAQLDLELRITKARNVQKALKGIQKEVTKTEKAARTEIQRTDKERAKAMHKWVTAQRRTSREVARIVKRAEAEKRREQERTNRELVRSRVAAEKKAAKESRDFRKALIGGATIGAAAAARAGFQAARGITGVPTIQENIQSAQRFELGITRLATRSGLNPAQVQQQVVDATRGTTVLPERVLRGAEAVQEKIGKEELPTFFNNAAAIVRISEGLDVPIENLAATTVELVRQFHIAEKDIPRALGLIAEQAEQGSIEFGDFSGSFRRVMGIFVQSMETDGIGGLREFGTLAQLLGESLDPDIARTALQKLVLDIQDTDTRKRLSKAFRRSGQDGEIPAQITDIVRKLEVADLPVSKLQDIFTEQRALLAVTTLLGATGKLDAILASDPQLGLDRADTTAAAVRGTERGKNLLLAVETNQLTIDSFKGASEAAREWTSWIERFIARNPGTAVAADTLAPFAVGAGSLLFGAKFLKAILGAAAPAAGAASTGTAAAATGAAATGVAAVALPVAIAGMTAGAATFFGNKLLEDAFGTSTADMGRRHAEELGLIKPSSRSDDDMRSERLLRATEANTRAVRNLGSAPGNPGDNGPP